MKEWSSHWKSSEQRRKQRKYVYNAPNHVRQKLVSAHLSPELRKQYSKRSLPVRKGDEVIITRGSHKGKSGKISKVDLKKLRVEIENIKLKKVSGQEVNAAIHPSNLKITKLGSDDKKRTKFVQRKRGV